MSWRSAEQLLHRDPEAERGWFDGTEPTAPTGQRRYRCRNCGRGWLGTRAPMICPVCGDWVERIQPLG